MLARIGGYSQGTAKMVNPVIVRNAPRLFEDHPGTAIVSALVQVLNDIGKAKEKRAVLSMSLYMPSTLRGKPMFPNPDGSDGYPVFRKTVGDLLRRIIRKGVTVVVPAGNFYSVSNRPLWGSHSFASFTDLRAETRQ